MESKRQRSENFNAEDKELLVERVMKKKDIVEMKKYDNVSAKAKEQAWQDIANDYNAYTTFPRTAIALKMCWENLKRKCRKSYAEQAKGGYASNGRRRNPPDPILDIVKDILISTSGLSITSENFFLSMDSSNSHIMPNEVKDEHLLEFEDHKAVTYEYTPSNWPESSPFKLKRSPSGVLKSTEKKLRLHSSSKTSPYIETLTSDSSESDTQENTDTILEAMNDISQSISSNLNNSSESKLGDTLGESSKTSPYVQKLTTETSSNGGKPSVEVSRANNSRNTVRSRRPNHQIKSLANIYTESKIELIKLAKKHAMSEEKRRNELHCLQVEETRLKIMEEKKRISLYELRAKETQLKIEALQTKLEFGIYD